MLERCHRAAAGSKFARNGVCCHVLSKHEDIRDGSWEAMVVSLGTQEGFEKPIQREPDGAHYSRHSDIKRVIKTMLPDKIKEYEKRANGGAVLTVVPPVKSEPS